MEEVRGLTHSTISGHLRTVSCFLDQLDYESAPSHLAELKPSDVETFITYLGKQHCRGTLQHEAADLRGFFRFGTASGLLPPGLDAQIDTPRLYRLEQLPRAVPWESVCALLDSIDRNTQMGMRDYAMLFLIATYALHLLRLGTSLKTIGDLLGHRTAESTCVYLRLAFEDLREVALNLPDGCAVPQTQEGQS